ncbi:MAG: hypothetical protein ACKVJX_07875 [Verrucomicrobiia bacterium]
MTELYEQARLLSPEEQRQLGQQLLVAAVSDDDLGDPQKTQIENVLLDRIDGPFVPLDDGFADRIKAAGRERLKNKSA